MDAATPAMSVSAKLRALVEAKDYVALSVAAPALARLVLELSEALEPIMADFLDTHYLDEWIPEEGSKEDFKPTPDDADWEEHCIPWGEVKRLRAALAAVEELEL